MASAYIQENVEMFNRILQHRSWKIAYHFDTRWKLINGLVFAAYQSVVNDEVNIMIVLDMSTGLIHLNDPAHDLDDQYPDQVLDSEWSPMLAELQVVQPILKSPQNTKLPKIETAVVRMFQD